MKIFNRRTEDGFTLMEAVITVAIYSLLFWGANTLFTAVINSPKQQLTSAGNVDQARRVLANFTNEIRNSAVGSDGSYQLNQAGDTQIIFYTTYKATGGIVNRVRYYLSGSSLFKGVVTPTGSPLSYNLGTEVITQVQSNLSNGSTPIFYYYDDTYSGTTSALAQPVNVTQVKFVKINLIVKNQESKTDATTTTIDGAAAIRSLKTNLGN